MVNWPAVEPKILAIYASLRRGLKQVEVCRVGGRDRTRDRCPAAKGFETGGALQWRRRRDQALAIDAPLRRGLKLDPDRHYCDCATSSDRRPASKGFETGSVRYASA